MPVLEVAGFRPEGAFFGHLEAANLATFLPDLVPEEWNAEFRSLSSDAVVFDQQRSAINFRCAAVVIARNRHAHAIDITFTEHEAREQGAALFGQSKSALRMELEGQSFPQEFKAHLHYEWDLDATPLDMLGILRWHELLRDNARLGLWSYRTNEWAVAPSTIPSNAPTLPEDVIESIRALAKIQTRASTPFAIPENLDETQSRAIRETVELLDGKTLTGTWKSALISASREAAAILEEQSSPYGAMLEFKSPFEVSIGDTQLNLGWLLYRIPHMKVAGIEPDAGGSDSVTVKIVAGQNSTLEKSATGDAVPDEDTMRQAARIEPFAGLWVSQTRNAIFASGDTALAANAAAHALGRQGALWKVPASRDEASSTVVGL